MSISETLRRLLQKPADYGWLRHLLQGVQPRESDAMAQGKPGKSGCDTGQIPEKQAEKAGSSPATAAVSDEPPYTREAFRDVICLSIALVDAPAHLQHELFATMDTAANKGGFPAFIAHGTDHDGHWLGWTPLH